MNPATVSALEVNYRREITSLIFRILRAGDSCSIVGVSGTAKSNLFRHLLHPQVRQNYLGDAGRNYLFLAADSHALPELSERAIYNLLLERLVKQIYEFGMIDDSAALVEQFRQNALDSDNTLISQGNLTQAVHVVMAADAERRLVFLFDQFDDVYKTASSRFFANLRSLRDDFKYRISYVTLTRDELPFIHCDGDYEEFHELLSPYTIGLVCYDHDDAWSLLLRVGGRYGLKPEADLGERLIALTHGHPGLLKAAFIAAGIRSNAILPDSDHEAIQMLLTHADVNTECSKLWGSIRQDEREALQSLAFAGRLQSEDPDLLRRLRLKGLVMGTDKGLTVFAPLFRNYLALQQIAVQPSVVGQLQPIRVDAAGEVWVEGKKVEPSLSPLEFRLLTHFLSKPNTLCRRDELIEILYPDDEPGEISDDAINSVVERLRKRIDADHKPPKYIITVRGRGYRLDM